MCGIAGVIWTAGARPASLELVRAMTDRLAHRGPDDSGYYHSLDLPCGGVWRPNTGFTVDDANIEARQRPLTAAPGAALGHRRLSIIDLSTSGRQPLTNEDGTLWITFNGEIYNYQELHRELVARGHRFHTATDTEAIVHLYEEYGPACVHRLQGMFAFAIWNARSSELFLARDRLGKKPLVYYHSHDRLLFASELKSLLVSADVPRRLDLVAVDEFLTYQYVPAPRCILSDVRKLPPAHWATYRDGKLTLQRYWQPAQDDIAPNTDTSLSDQASASSPRTTGSVHPAATYEDRQVQLRTLLTEAVRLRLRSDVPSGAFLSGGVDSTIIAGLMRQEAGTAIDTFSIGFSVKQFDERQFARLAAERFGTRHHEFLVEPSALDVLPKLVWHYDEPFADSSAIPTYYLSQVTRQHVTVALSGDGGDELFAGYERYLAVELAAWMDLLPASLRRAFSSTLGRLLPGSTTAKSSLRRLKRFVQEVGAEPVERYLGWISIFNSARRAELYSDSTREALHGQDAGHILRRAFHEAPHSDVVSRAAYADVLTYLPGDILTKVDIASMANGLEVRAPFLDQHVVQFAMNLQVGDKRSGWRGKRILLDAFRDLVPSAIRHRTKMGFGVPLDTWFRGALRDLVRDTLLSERARARGLFADGAVRRLVDEHDTRAVDHSARLWALIVLELWQQTFLDTPGAELCQ